MSRPIVIVYPPTQDQLAYQVTVNLNGMLFQRMSEVERQAAESPVCALPIPHREFPDGQPDIVLAFPGWLDGAHVVFVADLSDTPNIQRQLAVMYAMQYYGAHSLTVVVPYFPGTQERVEVPGRIAWSKTLARMLSAIPPCHGTGPARIVIWDIHAQGSELIFGDGVANAFPSAFDRERGMFYEVWTHSESWVERFGESVVCFPDQGAAKRYGYLEKRPIVCEKRRGSGGQRELHIVEGDPKDRSVLIVDDLVMSGGTILEAARLMREQGAKTVDALCVHGVLPGDAVARINASPHLGTLYVTDTIPRTRELAGDRIKVVSVVPQLASWLADHLD